MTVMAVEQALRQAQTQIERYDRWDGYYWSYNETSTRYILIDPVLKALGWDIYNMDQCAVEWPMPFDNPKGRADYVLGNSKNQTVIVIEAKSIKVSVGGNPRSFENKLSGYTRGMETGVAVLTNGLIWRLYELGPGRTSLRNRPTATVDIRNDDELTKSARMLHRWLNKRRWW